MWPVFVKPKQEKIFTGVVVNGSKDLIGCGKYNANLEVYCSEVIDFIA